MAVTELALLQLKPGHQISQRSVSANLRRAKLEMEHANGGDFTFYYFKSITEQDKIYLIGGWESVQQHMQEWIPSEANQGLLELLKDQLEVLFMFHVDIDRRKTEVPLEGKRFLEIVRLRVDDKHRKEVLEMIETVEMDLKDVLGDEGDVVSGWRLDWFGGQDGEKNGKEEWVALLGMTEDGMVNLQYEHQRLFDKILDAPKVGATLDFVVGSAVMPR